MMAMILGLLTAFYLAVIGILFLLYLGVGLAARLLKP